VSATVSTCPNNGSITVAATATHLPILYSLIAGPVIQPVQTNPVFTSLPPGNYTVNVADAAGNHSAHPIAITGNYTNVDFNPLPTTPHCPEDNNGSLTANLVPNTGLAPFSWQLITAAPSISLPQATPYFGSLIAGDYSMRVTDACNNLRTISVTLADPNTNMSFYGGLFARKIGCDSMRISYRLIVNELRMPMIFQYLTSNGTFTAYTPTYIDSTMLHTLGVVDIEQIIPGLTYGDQIQAIVTNDCGNNAVSTVLNTYPFAFYPRYTFNQCGSLATPFFENPPLNFVDYHTFLMQPVSYTFSNVATGIMVSSGTVPPNANAVGIGIPVAVPPGGTYHLTITDGCGETFQHDYVIPIQAQPQIHSETPIYFACIDSVVGTYRVETSGFGANSRLILLSGPATLGSTKPEYTYSGTYSYPDTIPGIDYFFLSNLAAGTYTYKIIDDCGHELTNAFTILPQEVTSLSRFATYSKGCPGQNKLYYGMIAGGKVTIRDILNDTVIKVRAFENYGGTFNHDSLLNVPEGQYEISYQYEHTSMYEINDTPIPCVFIQDTLLIAPYQFPNVTTNNSILCNNDLHLELTPDTTRGVGPYTYEIIGGPQLFPQQPANTFLVNMPGIYTVRIYDNCGNASSRQVTVDTLTFAPSAATINCNNAHIVFTHSLYETYTWTAPDNQVFVSDSLLISPVTAADTGWYHLAKTIHINGCTDTFYTAYHLALQGFLSRTFAICPGDSAFVIDAYEGPGIYRDTLQTAAGCDSIVQTRVTLVTQIDTNFVSICSGDSLEISGIYHTTPGIFLDSLPNGSGCYDYLFTQLRISGIPTSFSTVICSGDSILLGSSYYSTSGTHIATLPSSTQCDSIVTLHLTVVPPKQNTINHAMCAGETFFYNGSSYTQSGNYTHIFPAGLCDSTVTIHLLVYPAPVVSATASNIFNVQYGDLIQLDAESGSSSLIYSWTSEASLSSNSIRNPNTTVMASGWYVVSVLDANGCRDMDSIYIALSEISTLYVPNSFTPDGSHGANDIFRIGYSNLISFHILIFDRWGEVIFESSDPDFGWDGTYKGAVVQDGVYVYKINAVGKDNWKYNLTGHITVIK
jgi:gliding motility-associated-like protein